MAPRYPPGGRRTPEPLDFRSGSEVADKTRVGRLAVPFVAAVWLVVAIAAVGARRHGRQRHTARQWHDALATVSRWAEPSDDVQPAVTWCRTLSSPLEIPRQRLAPAADDEQRLPERRRHHGLEATQRGHDEAVEDREQESVAGSAA
jgi:hypothetical protein